MTKILIYGTTGYTGALVARTALQQGLKPIIAGRNAAKLQVQAAEWGVTYRAFSLDNPAEVAQALTDVTVVLNCAGPFRVTAPLFMAACLATQTHYLDLAGEVPEFAAAYQHHAAAVKAKIMVMPGVGFGVVPTDCLALYLKQKLPQATHLMLAFETIGGVSQGTLSTVLKDLHQVGVKRRNGALIPSRAAEQSRQINFRAGQPVTVVTNPWRGDLFTAFHTTQIPNIDTFIALPAPLRWLMRLNHYTGKLWGSAAMQALLDKLISRLPAGPSEAELTQGKSYIWGEISTIQGQRVAACLRGPDAYLFTALTATAIMQRILAGQVMSGFQTPAQCYGAEFVMTLHGVQRDDLA